MINAVLPTAFVSKEEIRRWPVIGRLAAKNDTVFLCRGSRDHARIINPHIAEFLAQGKHVAVFPEGTTTDGRSLLHFHAALLQPALAVGRTVLPAAISYWEPDGQRSLAPRYDGDISLGQCTRAILGRKRLIARLVTTPLLGLNGEDRRQVAAEAREAIASALQGLPDRLTRESQIDRVEIGAQSMEFITRRLRHAHEPTLNPFSAQFEKQSTSPPRSLKAIPVPRYAE